MKCLVNGGLVTGVAKRHIAGVQSMSLLLRALNSGVATPVGLHRCGLERLNPGAEPEVVGSGCGGEWWDP